MNPYRGTFGRAEAEHLLRRATFSAAPRDVSAALEAGLARTIDGLLEAQDEPAHLDAVEQSVAGASERRLLAGAWIHRMVHTRRPLRERMTLFWHRHFTSALSKVQSGAMMLGQIATFRRLATGSFRDLVLAAAEDPAMLRYLDLDGSRRDAPNENFARELFELFTVGPGHYTEEDIREAARAFTGWRIAGNRAVFAEEAHDGGEKTVLGSKGKHRGRDVVDLAVAHPAASRLLGTKLAREFVADDPEPSVVAEIAESVAARRGDVRAVLADVLGSALFFDLRHRRRITRSPTVLAVAALRAGGAPLSGALVADRLAAMGEVLLDPPTVEGYAGGRAWLQPTTCIARRAFLVAAGLRARSDADPEAATVLGTDADAAIDNALVAAARDRAERWAFLLSHPLFEAA